MKHSIYEPAKEYVYKRLAKHIREHWPENAMNFFTWELGPIQVSLPNFSVIRITPNNLHEPWVYISHGAWEVDSEPDYSMEFIITSPVEDPQHIETLAMVANFHADPVYQVHWGKSIDIGWAWLEGAKCNHLLVSLPYPFGPKLGTCDVSESLKVRYFWLLPITKAENKFLNEAGLEFLEQKFDEVGIEYLDINRASVV